MWYKYLFWLCFNLTACNTYILEPESRVKRPQDILCLELGKGIISNLNSWELPAGDVCLHFFRDPLSNISTKINGHERQCIIVNSKAKKEIREILWNSTQKYWFSHLRTLVSWELYLTRSVIESFCALILETMTEGSWITAREATWWKGSNNLLLSWSLWSKVALWQKTGLFNVDFVWPFKWNWWFRWCFTAWFVFNIEKFNIGVCSPFACSHAV